MILITGGQGQLGRALAATYADTATVVALGRDALDVTDRARSRQPSARVAPTLVIHAAAATDVDRCEREPEFAYRLNTLATRYLAAAAGDRDLPFVYVSTNYSFRRPEAARRGVPRVGRARAAQRLRPFQAGGRGGGPPPRAPPPDRPHLAGLRRAGAQIRADDAAPGRFGERRGQMRGRPVGPADLRGRSGAGPRRPGRDRRQRHLSPDQCRFLHLGRVGDRDFRLSGRRVAVEPILAATFRRDATPPANGVLANIAAAALGVALPIGAMACVAASPRWASCAPTYSPSEAEGAPGLAPRDRSPGNSPRRRHHPHLQRPRPAGRLPRRVAATDLPRFRHPGGG